MASSDIPGGDSVIFVSRANSPRRLSLLLAMLVAALAAFQGGLLAEQAQERQLVDGIVAIANDQVVTERQLNDALSADTAYLALMKQDPSDERAEQIEKRKQEALDLLIDRRLIVSEAIRIGVKPDEAMIQKRIDRAMGRFGITTPEQFEEALTREGFTLPLLKALYTDEYLEQVVVESKVRSTIEVSDAQIVAYAEENKGVLSSPERVNFAQILFKVEDFGDEAMTAAAKARAEQVLKRLQSGEPFDKVCESADDAVRSCDGLGFLRKDEMFSSVAQVAFELEIGAVSGAIESPMGFHVIKLLEKQATGFDMSPDLKQKIRETLYASEFEKRYAAFVKELRARSYIKIVLNAP